MTIDLRLIAIVTMLIDHVGFIFFPHQLIFRVIGRLSFPLFAWGIAVGAKYSHDIKKYALRLFILALISQYPFNLFAAIAPSPISKTNVLFTLFLGLLAIQTYKSKMSLFYKIPIYYLLFFVTQVLDSDYQIAGVLSILFSYLFMSNLPVLFITQLVIYVFPLSPNSFLTVFAPFAFFLTRLKSPSHSPKTKYLFYLIYPLQFLIIYLIKTHLILFPR